MVHWTYTEEQIKAITEEQTAVSQEPATTESVEQEVPVEEQMVESVQSEEQEQQ